MTSIKSADLLWIGSREGTDGGLHSSQAARAVDKAKHPVGLVVYGLDNFLCSKVEREEKHHSERKVVMYW